MSLLKPREIFEKSMLCLSLAGACALPGQAQAEDTISMWLLSPASEPVGKVDSVLVVSIEGDKGSAIIASEAVSALKDATPGASSSRTGGLPFDVSVDVKRTRSEVPVTGSVAAELAKDEGVSFVLVSSGYGEEINYETYSEDREEKRKTKNGEEVVKFEVLCASRTVEVVWEYTLFHSDGTVALADTGSSRSTDSDCDESGPDEIQLRSVYELWSKKAEGVAHIPVTKVRPRYHRQQIPTAPGAYAESTRDKLERGDWEAAAAMAEEHLQQRPFDHVEAYHGGIALLGMGDLQGARDLFAFAAHTGNRKVYSTLLEFIDSRTQVVEELRATYEPQPPGVAIAGALAIARATTSAPVPTGERVHATKLMGALVPLFTAAKSKEVVTEVPVRTFLYVQERDKTWLNVSLPNGISGWVRKGNTVSASN